MPARALRSSLVRALLLLVLAPLTGCIPDSVTLSLDGRDQRLREHTVIDDRGARQKIAQIDLNGLIADGERPGLIGSAPNPVDEFLERLNKAAKDDNVRAILVRIDSPGGTVTASDIIHQELRRVREETGKPIVAALGEVAASGGYYVALAGDEIVAHPTSITGSIGVIIPTFNFADGLSRIGITARAVVSGPNKNMADPFEPPDESHYAILQGMVDEYYARFRGLTIERRPRLAPSMVDTVTDGRVITGQEAVRVGLADSAGTVRDAFEAAKRLASVDHARLVKYTRTQPDRELTPYASAEAPVGPAMSARASIVDLDSLGVGRVEAGVAYYLWLP